MSPEAQRVALAELEGWIYPGSTCLKHEAWDRWIAPRKGMGKRVPDYLGDLNAIHAASQSLTQDQRDTMRDRLKEICVRDAMAEKHWEIFPDFATAAQRSEALLRTLGKWEDDK